MGQGHRGVQASLGHVDLSLSHFLLGAPTQQLGRLGLAGLNDQGFLQFGQGDAGRRFQTGVRLTHQLLQRQLGRLQGAVKLDAFGHGLLKTCRSQHLIGQGADFGHHSALDQLQQFSVLILGLTGYVQTLLPAQHLKELLTGLLHQAGAGFLQARLGQRQLGLRQTVLCIDLADCPQRLLDQQGRLGSPAGGRGFCAQRRIPRPLGCLQIGLRRLHLGLFGFHARVMGGREAQGIGQTQWRGRRH